ncbi:UBX domain-containing protein 2B [Tiliqua scincoides]|uniref:UBX domain-containing protein 2B n=1 Tax=Tiliqua scincoides TaxID=71010 RepID=UPI0034629515
MADGGAATGQRQEEEAEATGTSAPRKEKGPRGSGRPPTIQDLQLALAGLYEDEMKRQPSHPDKPAVRVASHSRLPVQSLKFDSLRSMRKPERSMSDDKDNQRFYSGDSEYKERQVIGPSHNLTPSKIVDELFKEAREHGAVPLDEVSRASGDGHKAKSFSGGGYRLGDSSLRRSEYIYGENQHGQDVQILLKLWRNGFSLDDGELRTYTDPVNAQFLESVKRGEIPAELQRLVHGGQVNLDMEDHQEQEYVRPRLKFKAFSGEGQKLGSLTPEIVSTPSSPEEEDKSILDAAILIDDSVPTTKIQIRLADGSRLIQRFNRTHRIIDIRNFIIQSRPSFASIDFVLLTTFPHKELTDESLTLQEADILNTVILQQLK